MTNIHSVNQTNSIINAKSLKSPSTISYLKYVTEKLCANRVIELYQNLKIVVYQNNSSMSTETVLHTLISAHNNYLLFSPIPSIPQTPSLQPTCLAIHAFLILFLHIKILILPPSILFSFFVLFFLFIIFGFF